VCDSLPAGRSLLSCSHTQNKSQQAACMEGATLPGALLQFLQEALFPAIPPFSKAGAQAPGTGVLLSSLPPLVSPLSSQSQERIPRVRTTTYNLNPFQRQAGPEGWPAHLTSSVSSCLIPRPWLISVQGSPHLSPALGLVPSLASQLGLALGLGKGQAVAF
jgi:hypothetical protein